MNRRVMIHNGEGENEDSRRRSSPEIDDDIPETSSAPSESNIDSASDDEASVSDTTSTSSSESNNTPPPPKESLKDISFGALAEAQAAFPSSKSRKRKAPADFDDTSTTQQQPALKAPPLKLSAPPKPTHRTSKHAPTILSSKQQVSRHRDIFDPSPSLKSRDPRFDPTIHSSATRTNTNSSTSVAAANKAYSFLTTYRDTEIASLKTQLAAATAAGKSTTSPNPNPNSTSTSELKRRLASLTSHQSTALKAQRRREIIAEHKRKEKAFIATGAKAKPYYLKASEVKKIAREERVEGMSKKAREKMEARKQKREKSKDARGMPRVRREGGGWGKGRV